MTKTILIAGGTGLIGNRLIPMLRADGWTIRLLTRKPKGSEQFHWDPLTNKIDPAALQGVQAVINLAGAGIADKRWTAQRKKELIESRVKAADLLWQHFSQQSTRPEVYLSASAIGFYGNSGEAWMSEDDEPVEESFMVDCCRQWESAADRFTQLGIRTAKFRIGVVLAQEGGALAEIIKPVRFGLGAYFGDGQAWWSWIHRDDVCGAFLWALQQPEASGVYNLVAPNPVRGKALVVSTAWAMRKKVLLAPAPSFVLRLMLGEMSAVILNSNRVSADKLLKSGFAFQYPELEPALRHIFATK
ncbi:MAG TPA: TIGR01777 family oxidoreductase [Saprospiraceae bacterium]|nr:TIGR01777 family oxidoreductase [Saprospiraceae bacterium]